MLRNRRPGARPARFPACWPSALLWILALAASLAGLLGVAYLIGRHNPPQPAEPVEAVLTAASSPGVAVAFTAAMLLVLAASVRHLVLHWLAWLPGRVVVSRFTAATRLTDVDVEQLTMNFRHRLATLHVQSPVPVPGAAPEGDFLDVLGRNGGTAGSLFGTLVALVRAATPTHAYEVHGVLRERAESPRFGLTIQVLRRPSEGPPPITLWGETWDVAIQRAADEATAAILPRTRRCRAPWGVWRGHPMPSGLLHAYEEGARLEHERRYDEALAAYWAAMEQDPMNMALRLRLGQLQERLGFFLDALATYWGMYATSGPAAARLPALLYRARGWRERRRALLSARYRRNVLLGGRVLTQQWRTPSDTVEPTARDRQREQLRACLRPRLRKELSSFASCSELDRLDAALREPPADAAEDDADFLSLRDFLGRYALRDSQRLRRRLALAPAFRRTALTPATVRLTEECIESRLHWIDYKRGRGDEWPPRPRDVTARIDRIERGRLRWRRVLWPWRRCFRLWHEHYNAACIHALPLQVADLGERTRVELARAAVERLEKAMAHADSGFIAGRRDWIVAQDPDLIGLRNTPQFKEFEVMFLPTGEVTPRRPQNVQQLESSRHTRALLVATGRSWQAEWQRRAGRLGRCDVDGLLGWFEDELQMWTRIATVARHYRHSGTRLQLVRAVRDCAERHALRPLAVPFPRYEQTPLPEPGRGEDIDGLGTRTVNAANDELARLTRLLHGIGAADAAVGPLEDLGRWRTTLRRLNAEARAPSRSHLEALCRHHAALWQLLAQWFDGDPMEPDEDADDFTARLDQARLLWRMPPDEWSPQAKAA